MLLLRKHTGPSAVHEGNGMGQMTAHIGIEPGNGLIARFGDTVVVVPREEPVADDGIRELLGLVASVAADEALSASMVAARLAAWVLGHMPGDAISFGMVAVRGSDVVVFLRGPVSCTVTQDGTTRELSGERALTWVDEAMPATFDQLTIAVAAGRTVAPEPLSDLREGVVLGQAFALTWLGAAPGPEAAAPQLAEPAAEEAPVPEAEPPAAAPAAEDWASPAAEDWASPAAEVPAAEDWASPAAEVPAAGDAPADPVPAAEELPDVPAAGSPQPSLSDLAEPPLEYAPPAADEEPGPSPLPLGHQETIAVASMPLPQQQPGAGQPGSAQPTMVVSPIGELRSEDGTVIYLDRAYVLGRGPHQDPSVISGHASPLPLRDPDNLISRIHAYLWVDQGLVWVRDPGSTHGTFISAPGAPEWTRIGTDPAQLPPTWSLRIGQQVFTYVVTGPLHGQ
jgi:hypothetical protein